MTISGTEKLFLTTHIDITSEENLNYFELKQLKNGSHNINNSERPVRPH